MKTLTITEGRGRLGYWLKKAVQGEDIGFLFEGKVVALRPVEVHSNDYALQEYGLTPFEMAMAEKRIAADIKSARRAARSPNSPAAKFEPLKKRKPGHNSGLITHTHLRTQCA